MMLKLVDVTYLSFVYHWNATAAMADAGTTSSVPSFNPGNTPEAPTRTGFTPSALTYARPTALSLPAHPGFAERSAGAPNSVAENTRFFPPSPHASSLKPPSSINF